MRRRDPLNDPFPGLDDKNPHARKKRQPPRDGVGSPDHVASPDEEATRKAAENPDEQESEKNCDVGVGAKSEIDAHVGVGSDPAWNGTPKRARLPPWLARVVAAGGGRKRVGPAKPLTPADRDELARRWLAAGARAVTRRRPWWRAVAAQAVDVATGRHGTLPGRQRAYTAACAPVRESTYWRDAVDTCKRREGARAAGRWAARATATCGVQRRSFRRLESSTLTLRCTVLLARAQRTRLLRVGDRHGAEQVERGIEFLSERLRFVEGRLEAQRLRHEAEGRGERAAAAWWE
jgi:hypothetical protein